MAELSGNQLLLNPPLSEYTWVLWSAGFTPANKTEYKIVVRATDKLGKVQIVALSKPFPVGATGYHTIEA